MQGVRACERELSYVSMAHPLLHQVRQKGDDRVVLVVTYGVVQDEREPG